MTSFKKLVHLGTFLAMVLGVAGPARAAAITIPSGPLYVGAAVQPLVMLDITKDQNLYKKAYDDYSDLNGDGTAETTYDHTIDYYGYFDSYKCYSYGSGYFSPVTADPTSGNPVKPSDCAGNWHGNFLNWVAMSRMDTTRKLLYGGYRSTDTSSTILERAFIPTDSHAWAKYYNPQIARQMDLDPLHQATLSDRYPDTNKLTPFNPAGLPAAVNATSSSVSIAGTQATPVSRTFTVTGNTDKFSYGDQVLIELDSNNYMIGAVSCVNGTGISMYNSLVGSSDSCSSNQIKVVVENSFGSGSATSWKIYNYTQTGISFCNATPDPAKPKSQASTAPPLMRAALGNFSLWSANERWQCVWREDTWPSSEDTGGLGNRRTNGNRAALSGLWASTIGPNKTTTSAGRIANGVAGSNSDYIVRVEACVSGKLGNEKCAKYPAGNYKPIGLLQYYGESGQLKFGMFTGSYEKNQSGGVLRKNISNIVDEINVTPVTGNGSIKTTIPTTGSIIQTLNKMRIVDYDYNDGSYGSDCTYGKTQFAQGKCKSWGNPISEVYLESLRYLAGKTPFSDFSVATTTDDGGISGLRSVGWTDPLSTSNYCAPLNVLVFNSAVNSNEKLADGQMARAADLGTTGNTCNAATWTNKVGDNESITGNSWFIGNNGAGSTPADLCSTKVLADFSAPFGICPEGAGTEGSYLTSGLAYFARTNRIRDPATLTVPSSDYRALKVATYGIALATNTPKVRVNVGGRPVVIVPQGRLDAVASGTDTGFGSGAIVNWKIVCEIPASASDATRDLIKKLSAGRCSTKGTGAFYWNQEDSEQGGDYDQDMWGRVQYDVTGSDIKITTDVVAQSTPYVFGFGYAISGTTKDGPHFHSGINKFKFTDSTGVTACSGTNGCEVTNAASSVTYTTSASAANVVLKDPLWYAAKYGGFKDDNGNNKPDTPSATNNEWDIRNADGSTTGCTAAGCDGVPDNFFLVTNPNYLEDALDKAFVDILGASSASSVATNSTSLQKGSRVYQARFNSNDWSGQLRALNLNPANGNNEAYDSDSNGSLDVPALAWDSGQVINTQNTKTAIGGSDTRTIITYGVNGSVKQGIPFRWADISAVTNVTTTQKDALNSNGLGTSDSRGAERLEYLRGSQVNEGKSATSFRPRPTSRLGDIVNSSPVYVGAPEAGWAGSAYLAFRKANLARTPILYTGANDGMLHAFRASDGQELLAYVPSVFFNNTAAKSNLSQLTNLSYSHKYFVDGTPMVNDIEVVSGTGVAWKTVLVGGLNWGGRAFYALDITNPDVPASGTNNLAFSEGNASRLAWWEFTNANDSDLGYTINQPTYPPFSGISEQIVKMRNGKWAVILGNGYNSDNGKAALFIFFLDRATKGSNQWVLGTDYVKLVADMQVPSNYNGLSTPMPFSARADGVIDWVYAGDLNGNLWKFDVTDSDTTKWAVSYNSTVCTSTTNASTCTPLYTAKDALGNPQPITVAPRVTRHPSGGAMVLFGTGKYLEASDTISPFTTQTYYGIWDNGTNKASNLDRTKLLKQEIAGQVAVTDPNDPLVTNSYRVTTDRCVVAGTVSGSDVVTGSTTACNDNWNDGLAKEGWYMDLTDTGERVAYNAVLRNDRIVFPTLVPSPTPCLAGGDSWLMELDALTGRRLTQSPFDVNGSGAIDSTDKVSFNSKSYATSGFKSGSGGISTTPTVIKDPTKPDQEYKYISTSTGEVRKVLESVSQGQAGRITWREIVQ